MEISRAWADISNDVSRLSIMFQGFTTEFDFKTFKDTFLEILLASSLENRSDSPQETLYDSLTQNKRENLDLQDLFLHLDILDKNNDN